MAWEVCRRGDLAALVASSGSHVKTGSRFCVFGAKSTSSLDVGRQQRAGEEVRTWGLEDDILLAQRRRDTKSHFPSAQRSLLSQRRSLTNSDPKFH